MNKRGVSLLEILIALGVFALVMLGFSRLLLSARRFALHNRLKIIGGGLGAFRLEGLQMNVRQDLWDSTNCLNNKAQCDATTWTDPTSGKVFTPEYDVSVVGNLRKVKVKVSWPD